MKSSNNVITSRQVIRVLHFIEIPLSPLQSVQQYIIIKLSSYMKSSNNEVFNPDDPKVINEKG